jgi:RHS repeat-associated protein
MATSSADPDDLKTFVDQASPARTTLASEMAGVRATYNNVTPRCADYQLNHPGLWTSFDVHLGDEERRESFVSGVRDAFVAADRGGVNGSGPVTVDDEAIRAQLRQRGVEQLPTAVVTVDAPEILGRPPDSGYANDPVCTANGNFVEAEWDLPMPGRAALVSWQRTYNSRAHGSRLGMGRGWACWADTALVLTPDSVRWRGLDGASSTVARPAVGERVRIPFLDVEVTAAEDGFRVDRDGGAARGGQSWWYDAVGRPVRVAADGSEATLVWDGTRLVRLVHPRSGRWVAVEWAIPPSCTEGTEEGAKEGAGEASGEGSGEGVDERMVRITAVRCSDGREVRYDYDGAGDLVAVAGTPRGGRRYEVADGLLVAVVDADGVTAVRNGYDPAGRVLTQLSAEGRAVRFTYEEGYRTVVTDEAGGAVNAYQHDAGGRLIAVVDDHGHTMRRYFDHAGRLSGVRERSGARWRMTHDPAGNLVGRVAPGGATEQWTWDDLGRLTSYTDPNGGVTRWSYGGSARTPVEVVDPSAAIFRITVGDDDLPTCVVDPDGVSTHFRWSSDGQLTETRGAEGVRTGLRYDDAGRLVGMVDAAGEQTSWEIDPAGRVLVEHAPGGRVSRFAYSPAGRVVGYTDPAGGQWRTGRGSHGRVTRTVDPAGSTVGFDYDAFGNTTLVVAPDGQKFQFGYDGLNRQVTAADPAGATSLRGYDADGRVDSEIDADGNEWRREYDDAGRHVASIAPDDRTWRRQLDPAGNVVTETDPAGATTRYEHDPAGRVVAVTDPAGRRSSYTWTPGGRLAAVTSPGGRTTSYRYDRAGRLVEIGYPSGARVRFHLDTAGRVTSATAPSGRTAAWAYDAAGQVVETRSPDGQRTQIERNPLGLPTRVTTADRASRTFTYDPRGALTGATDPLGATTRYRYDARGRLASWTDPTGGLWTQEYDEVGRPVAGTDPLGRRTASNRDHLGRTVARRYADGTGQRWWYDRAGRLTGTGTIDDPSPRIAYRHDPAGRLVTAAEDGRSVELTYDEAGRLVSRTTPSGRLEWAYDIDDRCVAVGRAGDAAFRFDYDDDGRLATVSHPTLGTRTIDRDEDGRPRTARSSAQRDAAGRIVRLDRDGHTLTFGYDPAGQLVSAEGPWGVQRLTWDAGGRRTVEETPAGTSRCSYDAAGQLAELHRPDGVRVSFSYDTAGRRTTARADDGTSVDYAWDPLGRFTGVTRRDPSGATTPTRLRTDALGDPMSLDGRRVLWDPVAWPGEARVIGDTTVARAGTAFGLATRNADPDTAAGSGWHETDWQGSPASYDPWGLPHDTGTGRRQAPPPELGYRGELTVDGLVWQRDRVLDPATRSFLSPDPLPHVPAMPAVANPYHYAWNDPIGLLDPTGQRPLSDNDLEQLRQQRSQGRFDQAWQAIKEDPWGSLAAAGVVVVGVGLCFTPAAGIGVGILIGAGISGGMGLATGNFDPRQVAIGGVAGAVGGGVAGAVGKYGATALARFGSYAPAIVTNAAGGAGGDLAYQQLTHPGHLDAGQLAVSTATGGLLGAGGHYLSNLRTPAGSDALVSNSPSRINPLELTAGPSGGHSPPVNVLPSSGRTFVGTPQGNVYDVPAGWTGRVADNGKGIVYQQPGSAGNADMIRIMDPTPKYPDGYVRVHNQYGQPVDVFGKPGPQSATHIPGSYTGPWPGWPS